MKYEEDARPLNEGDYVKMNPFTVPDTRYPPNGSMSFKGELKVRSVYKTMTGDRIAAVQGSNNWYTHHLLIKGVDYDA